MPLNKPSTESSLVSKAFKAHYTPWIGGSLLALGIGLLLVALWIMLLGGKFTGTMAIGVLLTIVGLSYLIQPYFVIRPNRITVHNVVRSHPRRYPFNTLSDFAIENGKVYIIEAPSVGNSLMGDSDRTNVNLSVWATKPSDWKKFQKMIRKSSEHQD